MTKLEPTRTSSDLTATERLRTLLDERGVEWDYGITGATTTRFDVNGVDLTFTPMCDGLVCSTILTPEQAIAATLGRGMLTADDVRDLIERHSDASGGNGRDFHNGAYVAIADELNATLGSCNCSNSERTNALRLPHFWTHDGTLHIEATRMPTRIVVCEGGTCEFVPERELDASEAENAKLRELVSDFDKCLTEAARLAYIQGHITIYDSTLLDSLHPRMRELGIEVDG